MNPTSLLSGLGAAITADPALGGASTAHRESAPGTGDLFLSLVAGLLSGEATKAEAGPSTPAGQTTDPTADPAPEAGTSVPAGSPVAATDVLPAPTPPAATVSATALPLTDLSLTDVPLSSGPGVAAPVATSAVDTPSDEVAPDPATPDDPEPTGATLATLVAQATVPTVVPQLPPTSTGSDTTTALATKAIGDATAPVAAPVAAAAAGAVPGHVAEASGATRPDTSAGGDQEQGAGDQPPAGQPATAPAQPRPDVSGDPVAIAPAAPGAAVVAPVTTPATAAATAPVTAPATVADPQRVTGQVFPEVVRVASGADGGPQRVTVKLNPEALGEVRVVLTHHKGQLHVTLAGGEDARRAMAEGAPELRRLLEAVGRTESRIVIRDLPTSPTPAVQPAVPDGSTLRTDVSTDLGGDAGSGAGRPGGEPAADREATRYRTPGSTTATDGTPGATILSRPRSTDTSGRLGGLDVSI